MQARIVTTCKAKKDEDQVKSEAGEQTIQPVHEAQGVRDDAFPVQIVLLGIFIHNLGAN